MSAGTTERIFVGTSGYSYTEWVAFGFYPAGSKPGQMLGSYAQRFAVTELNHTWYQMPKAEAIERQRGQVPPDFRFTAKLNRIFTHEELPDDWKQQVAVYRHGLAPLIQSGQLMAVLMQFPASFDRSVANRRRLAALLDEMSGLPLAVEFRQGSWNTGKVFAELEKREVTLVAVDEPRLPGLFPPLEVITNPSLFYVRFHGRNVKGWGSGSKQTQFDYDYSLEELEEWVRERIAPMAARAGEGVIFFNNHVRGQAPRNAMVMAQVLREHGLADGQI